MPQVSSGVPTVSLSNPFPAGVVQPSGNTLGLLTGTGGDIFFVDPNRGAPRVQQYSADFQRELPGGMSISLGYTGLTGSNLSWAGSNAGATAGYININQLDPKYQSLPADYTLANVPNPFFGVAGAGQFSTARRRSRAASCCGRSRSSATSTWKCRPARTRSTTPASSSCASASAASGAARSATPTAG